MFELADGLTPLHLASKKPESIDCGDMRKPSGLV